MTAATSIIAQSSSVLDSDEADSEPPQQLPSTSRSNFQPSTRTSSDNLAVGSERVINESHDIDSRQDSHQETLLSSSGGLSVSPTPSSFLSSSPASTSVLQNFSNLSLSPSRTFPTSEVEIHDTIPEEDDETDYDTPNEPVTPVSGRQSREGFSPTEPESDSASIAKAEPGGVPHPLPISSRPSAHHSQKNQNPRNNRHRRTSNSSEIGDSATSPPSTSGSALHPAQNSSFTAKPARHLPLSLSTNGSTLPQPIESSGLRPESPSAARPNTAVSGSFLIIPPNGNFYGDDTVLAGSQTETGSVTTVNRSTSTETIQNSLKGRRQSRGNGSTSSFKRTMSSLFRRSNSQHEKAVFNSAELNHTASDSNLLEMAAGAGNHRKTPARRWSMHRSLATTQSNSPPSPGSPPLEMILDSKRAPPTGTTADASVPVSTAPSQQQPGMPTNEDFISNESKKHRQRASTTLSFHNAIHIVTGATNPLGSRKNKSKPKRNEYRRRASSFEHGSHNPPIEIGGELWALPAEAGTGLKARRMSLSLPDDFTVDVVDLHSEFDYTHMLGRHRRHLGKGATSKVTLMFRKGFPDELYAVKEFRGKSSSETTQEYEKKVKSEYSLAKSLHHPNIVETVRLCSDHGRWNHVMEYCPEGDLFTLCDKGYLCTPEREKDRFCLFKQLIQGLKYLHSNGIAHRDIKLENLLITNSSKLKITDFGASDVFSGVHPGLREAGGRCGSKTDDTVRLCRPGICGSLPYISPEVLASKGPYDPRKLDVWAAAIVMLNLLFGKSLWAEASIDKAPKGSSFHQLWKGWEKYNMTHLPKRLKAEQDFADKMASKEAELNTVIADLENLDPAAQTIPESEATAATAAAPTTAAISQTDNAPALSSSAETPAARPTVDAAPITDGNPNSIVEGDYPKVFVFDEFVNPPILRRILIQMLNPDPNRRPTIDQVANLRWIRAVECCQPESYEDPMAPASAPVNTRPIDASKRSAVNFGSQKIFCHDHLPPKHSLSLTRIG